MPSRELSVLVWLVAGLAAAGVTTAAVWAPLLVYSVSLAAFGAAHVLSELRYVDRRFGRGIGAGRLAAIGVLLAGAVTARALGVFHILETELTVPAELAFVTALALAAADGASPRSAVAVALGIAIGAATLLAPFDTIIALALLHNLTPLAFLWEILSPRVRRLGMPIALVAFLGLPILVATGWPRLALGGVVSGLDPLGAGGVADHYRAYLPGALGGAANAIDLFSAAVVAQCAHYAAVILVLPALLARSDPRARGLLSWPQGWTFAGLVATLCAVSLYAFSRGFAEARALYSIAASVHAWIEIPLIVVALTRSHERGDQLPIHSPAATDAALPSTETTSA